MLIPSTAHSRRCDPRATAGFTLVELLVAMVLVSLIMIAALNAFEGSRRIARKNLSVNEAQQQGSYALQEMAVSLRRAGYQLGPKFAILQNMGRGGAIINASWDNYAGVGATQWIWQTEASGAPWIPVPGTDAITIKFGDDQPPIHVCVMPSASANTMDLSYDPALLPYYPVAGQAIDVITTSTCNPTGGGPGTNLMTVVVNTVQGGPVQCANAGGGGQNCTNNPDTCYCKDPLCKNLQLTQNCFSFTFLASLKPNCDFCEKGPSYIVASRSASFWISTEDRTGVIYTNGALSSRPVLVGRYGLTSPTRIVANDIEDLQLGYLLNSNNVLDDRASLPPLNTDLPKTRALRVSLTARTGVTDLMAKNYAYCSAKPAAFTQLFSRPALENHPATATGTANTDYCDGFRRVVYNQVINLPNMTSFPIGKAGTS